MSAAETPEPLNGPEPLGAALRLEGAPAPGAEQDDWAEENFFRVVLNLEGGDWVEVATFADEDEAESSARGLVSQLSSRAWPRVKSRYLRPETILSVEVSARRRYTGSSARRGWTPDS